MNFLVFIEATCGPTQLSNQRGIFALHQGSARKECTWKFNFPQNRTDLILSIKITKMKSSDPDALWNQELTLPDGNPALDVLVRSNKIPSMYVGPDDSVVECPKERSSDQSTAIECIAEALLWKERSSQTAQTRSKLQASACRQLPSPKSN